MLVQSSTTRFPLPLLAVLFGYSCALFSGCHGASSSTSGGAGSEFQVAAQQGVRASLRVMAANRSAGSGFFIHPSGIAVTNAHVVEGAQGGSAQLTHRDSPGGIAPFEVIARGPSRDLALLHVDVPHPVEFLALGFSGEASLGEMVIATGAPQGMFPMVTSGVLSGRSRPGAVGPLGVPEQLVHSAPTLRGSSGCPIISVDGFVIGVQSAKPGMEMVKLAEPKDDAGHSFDDQLRRWSIQTESFGLAVPIDDLRVLASAWVAPEWETGLSTGFHCAPMSHGCLVSSVEMGGAADRAGLLPGDLIVSCNSEAVISVVDLAVSLRSAAALELGVMRGSARHEFLVHRDSWRARKPQALAEGLLWREAAGGVAHLGEVSWADFYSSGVSASVRLSGPHIGKDAFALEFTAWLDVPEGGLWSFELVSDDGSQLFLRDKLVVDCDGLHARRGARGSISLEAGLQPIRVTYFDAGGEEVLELRWALEGQELREIPAAAFSHSPFAGW